MPSARFDTALQVFETFPMIARDMTAAPAADQPLDYLAKLLASGSPEDAVTFCAYLLDKRQAVWWATSCLRRFGHPRNRPEEVAIKLAEAWVRDPEEHRRISALELGLDGDHNIAATWAALAAGSSGGLIKVGDDLGPPVPAHATARAARMSVLVALAEAPVRERLQHITACVDIGRGMLREKEQP